jgi:hypothetical protein
MVIVFSAGTTKWNVKVDCGQNTLAYGCGVWLDNNAHIKQMTDSCKSGTFEPFKIPEDKDFREVIRYFCKRHDNNR